MFTIGDLVSADGQAEFRNDVQLDAYDNPQQNLALLRSYLFSTAAPERGRSAVRSISSIGLLEEIVEAFLRDRLENRLVAIANYGHGKTHLALALANFFSRSFGSEEITTLLNKINHSVADPARSAQIASFKEINGEFLVIRLRGDIPRSLREQFLTGLEQSLTEHSSTVGAQLPFWYTIVEDSLNRLNEKDRERADAFLGPELDVQRLIDQVRSRRDVYDLCVRLFTHLHNIPPDLKGAVSLRDMVNWVVQSFCGVNRPLRGVLILFDEFSAYVQRYAMRNAAGELQDLLNGVDNQRGKVVFLAFAQHDPNTVADNMLVHSQVRDGLKKELTRLPRKLELHSLLESVIDAYLKQHDANWKVFIETNQVQTDLLLATGAVNRYFDERYGQTLRWSPDQVRTRLTKGCFPLHPLTTAFLSCIKLDVAADMGTPRRTLGFVFDQLNARRHQPALVNKSINWILPIELVDYFEAGLAGEYYKTYEDARRIAHTVAHGVGESLIKARLLQQVAGLVYAGEDQVQLLAELAGLDPSKAQMALDKLVAAHAIRHDVIRKAYEFWTIGSVNPEQLERLLSRQMEYLPFDQRALEQLSHEISDHNKSTGFGKVSVSVAWGNETDWAAREFILTREFCTADVLREITPVFQIRSNDFKEGMRGALVWYLARNEDDIAWFRSNMPGILDNAFISDSPIPIVCVAPREPHPEVIEAFQRMRALKQLTRADQQKVGQELYNSELEHAVAALTDSLPRMQDNVARAYDVTRQTGELIVPLAYRAPINALPGLSIHGVLSECYKLAYRFSPPEFFNQYQVTNAKLRNAVKTVAVQLLRGAGPNLRDNASSEPVARDLCEKLLSAKWRLLTSDYRLQKPTDSRVQRAWLFLDQTFEPSKGEVRIRDGLIPLFNTPYGYDFNTVTLLFCAWFGANAHDLRLTVAGQNAPASRLAQWLNSPQEFVRRSIVTHNPALARREPGGATREIRMLVDRIMTTPEASVTHEDAEQMQIKLSEYIADERNDRGMHDSARNAAERLRAARVVAQQYEKQVRSISQTINTESNIERLLNARNSINELPRLGIVSTTAAQPMTLQEQLARRLRSTVEASCQRYEVISNRTQLELHRTHLDQLRTQLQHHGQSEFLPRANLAMDNLARQAERLELDEREDSIRIRIQALDERARLRTLYESRDWLEAIFSHSQQTLDMRDKRLATINSKIADLERRIVDLQTSLSEIDSKEALDAWRRRSDRTEREYQDTPYQDQLAQLQLQAEPLQAYFAEIGGIASLQLVNPQEAATAKQQLADLEQRYGGVVGAKAIAMIAETRKIIQHREHKRKEAAMAILAQLEATYRARASLIEVKSKLESVPSFLPNEGIVRWQTLNAKVQNQLDRDQVTQIEMRFRQIMDVSQRVECINRLQSIMNEATQPPTQGVEGNNHVSDAA